MVEFKKIKRGEWMIHYHYPTGIETVGPFSTKRECRQFNEIAILLSEPTEATCFETSSFNN